ncbi:MAG: F0F1 ATP synthase subunit alpha [Candidatus Omnitrophica bacterium]|nr:F0F1 ATP synthase subunit alpha [Candidatus Omnitrophota bacterium]MDD5661240.1 F0F1 ATP synthase subunit alpha [Candidatus Omnitrophota bacterium]
MKIDALDIKEVGHIEELRQGIVKISGLPNCSFGSMIEFESGLKGMIVEFNPEFAFGIVFGDERRIKVGDTVASRGALLNVSVGDNFIGRVVDSLGNPIDAKGKIEPSASYPVFRQATGVMEREPISQALHTGIKIIDLLIPLGKGQRELVVGDRQIGKTTIGLDTIINQKGKNVICIYCWIGGSSVAFNKIMQTLNQQGCMSFCLAVSASASSSASEQYICPYTAAALGEYFMHNGKDVLIIFDDLTKHSWVYRQMSLLLERAPGREAYPGDIFFLHSQLMERAGRLKQEFGGGSMTFLPLAETLQGDITGYICSNIVSMTDGQIYLNAGLFQEGFKPAIDLELSVSRIGSKVQCPAIRKLSQGLRYEYVQYRTLLRLTRLRTKLSPEAAQQLQRGKALYELLIQENGAPLSQAEEIATFYAFSQKILESISLDQVKLFKNNFFAYLCKHQHNLVEQLNDKGELTEAIKSLLDNSIRDFFRSQNK